MRLRHWLAFTIALIAAVAISVAAPMALLFHFDLFAEFAEWRVARAVERNKIPWLQNALPLDRVSCVDYLKGGGQCCLVYFTDGSSREVHYFPMKREIFP